MTPQGGQVWRWFFEANPDLAWEEKTILTVKAQHNDILSTLPRITRLEVLARLVRLQLAADGVRRDH